MSGMCSHLVSLPEIKSKMNIFVLDEDPKVAAQMMCDKHVVKMILESDQILSTVCWKQNIPAPYQPTHVNHPSVVWAGKSRQNYRWLLDHLFELLNEYNRRYDKIHKVEYDGIFNILCSRIISLKFAEKELTSFPQCMPDTYRSDNPVIAYRNYYKAEKSYFAKWKMGNTPYWWAS